jgi:hypothetical protein
VTTPEEFWLVSGLIRLICPTICTPGVWQPGGAGWPDELWKRSGLFDLTIDQSAQQGAAILDGVVVANLANGNDHLVIYGISQGAVIANMEKQRLAEQYPEGTKAPDISFVLQGDLNLPDGGLHARFPSLHIPILDWTFNGPEPTDTQFHTDVITRQYDGFADFPLYPLNVIADLNAILGMAYVHGNSFDVSLPDDPTKSKYYRGTYGDTDYYFFPTQDLPLFDPLRTLGVPEPVIDVVEPVFRVIVERGYDRSIPSGEPTPARLIRPLDPGKGAKDLADAVVEGVHNAAALIGSPLQPSVSRKRIIGDVNAGVAQGLAAVRSQLPASPAVNRGQTHRTIVRSAGGATGAKTATAKPVRKTPARDAVKKASRDIKKFRR